MTGLSIGEITALVFAGALSFESALSLIKERGKAMNKNVSNFNSGICNIYGLSISDLQLFLDKNFPSLEIAIEYGYEISAVAGSKADLSMLEGILLQKFKYQQEKLRVVHCNVAGAFHTSYMAEAAKRVSTVLEDIEVLPPKIPIIMNATGRMEDYADDIKRLLGEQIAAPVKWKQSMITAHDSGVREFIEIAPSGYLCSMLKTIKVCSGCSTRLR